MEKDIRFTHRKLIEQCKAGHRASQQRLYSLYVSAMYNTAMRMTGSREDAEDIIQESFVAAYRNLASFNYESSFGAWLKRIVVNRSINLLKSRRVVLVPLENHESYLHTEEPISEEVVDIEKVKRGIKELPTGYRQIVTLYLIEGYDHKEIAEILGISTSTSKSQYHRAKRKLLQMLNNR